MPLIWAIACKLLGLQCSSFAKRCSYILSWEWLWSLGRPHSTAKVCQLSTPLSNKMIKICNSGYAQKSPYWDLTFLGMIRVPLIADLMRTNLQKLYRLSPKKSSPNRGFFGHNQGYKFLSFYLITVGQICIFLLWNGAVQKTITTLKTIYRGSFVQKMGTVAPVVYELCLIEVAYMILF